MNEDTNSLRFLMEEVLRVKEIKNEVQKDMNEVDEYLKELEQALLDKFNADGITSSKDTSGNLFSMVTTSSAVIEDYDAFTKYVIENGRTDLFWKRVKESEIKKMWDNGEEVPGIEMFSKIGLRVRKG